MAPKFQWNNISAPSFGDISGLVSSYVNGQKGLFQNINKPLQESLGQYQATEDKNAQSRMEANTGALIDAIRNGKNPVSNGYYDSKALADASYEYKKYQQELAFKKAAEARAAAAARRAANKAKQDNLLMKKLNELDMQLVNGPAEPAPKETFEPFVPPNQVSEEEAKITADLLKGANTNMDNWNKEINPYKIANEAVAPTVVGNPLEPYYNAPLAPAPTVDDYLTEDNDLGRAIRAYDNGGKMPEDKTSATLIQKMPDIAEKDFQTPTPGDGIAPTKEMEDALVQQILSNPNVGDATFTGDNDYLKDSNAFLMSGDYKVTPDGKYVEDSGIKDAGYGAAVSDMFGGVVSSQNRGMHDKTPLEKYNEELPAALQKADAESKAKIEARTDDAIAKAVMEASGVTEPPDMSKTIEPGEIKEKKGKGKVGGVQKEDGSVVEVKLDPVEEKTYKASKKAIEDGIKTADYQEKILLQKMNILSLAGKSTNSVRREIENVRKAKNNYRKQLNELEQSHGAKIQIKKQMSKIERTSKKILEPIQQERKKLDAIKITQKNKAQVMAKKEMLARKEYKAKLAIIAAKEAAELQHAKDANERLAVQEKYKAERELAKTNFNFATTPTTAEKERKAEIDAVKKAELEVQTAKAKTEAEEAAKGNGYYKTVNGKKVYVPNYKNSKAPKEFSVSDLNDKIIKDYGGKEHGYGAKQSSPGRFTDTDTEILDMTLGLLNKGKLKRKYSMDDFTNWLYGQGYLDLEDSNVFEQNRPGLDLGITTASISRDARSAAAQRLANEFAAYMKAVKGVK